MNFSDPRAALTTVSSLLSELRLPETFGSPAPTAFEKVRIFDLQDLATALEDLLLTDNRVAIVALDSIRHDVKQEGYSMFVERSMDLMVFFADRRWSDRQKALMGETSITPGALLLAHIAVNGITGQQDGFTAAPGLGRLATIEDEQRKNLTGRITFAQEFELRLGVETIGLNAEATL